MPITLDGVALENAEAPVLFQTCRFPIMDLRRYRVPDEVVQNMPTFLGGWADGTIAPALDSQVIDIDTETNAEDDCRFPVVSVALESCSWIAPDQVILGVESEQINWKKLKTRFCEVANIALDRIGQIFNRDGTLVTGNRYALNIVRFAMNALIEALGVTLTTSTMVGDAANTNQFNGLYTQIDFGWEESSDACAATLNVGNEVNWDLMTGGSGVGVASPDAVTVESTITLWGQTFDVPAGWTLGDFLAYYAEAVQANYGRGFDIMWEMHAPSGWRLSILKALSCIQLCNQQTFIFTDSLRERYERLIGGRIAELFGYGLTFPILETGHLVANTLRFGPRELGGVPTYGLVFENIVNVLRDLNPIGQALYGSGQGRIPADREPMLGMTREKIRNRFEALTLHWDFLKQSATCVLATILMKAGMLVTERHMWLKITNVGVPNFRLDPPADVTQDGVAIEGVVPAAPTLNSPADTATVADLTPDLVVDAVADADDYDFVVATDPDFATIVAVSLGQTATTFTVSPALTDGTLYYWRARANNEHGSSAWSVTRSFTADVP